MATIRVGARVGRYRLEEVLGRGGMGVVYRAYDDSIGRAVAVKVLADTADPERLERFRLEAGAAGTLEHPNIIVVHDFGSADGVPYIVTELLEGETLRERLDAGPITPADTLDIARQIARALATIHARGIVHRDLKPANVFITADRRVKVLDFGLSHVRPAMNIGEAPAADSTATDAALGTAGYMSPEQVRGKPADARSDVFAFGSVLYEMLAGRRAYPGDTAIERAYATVTSEPPPIGRDDVIAGALEPIARRCLRRAPAERFATGQELLDELDAIATAASRPASRLPWRLIAAALGLLMLVGAGLAVLGERRGRRGHHPTVAVLPFRSFSADTGEQAFADEVQDDLIARLARVRAVAVISRLSTERYRRTETKARDIARELGADRLVEGSVQRIGKRVRIDLALLDAEDRTVWSRRYDREAGDELALQAALTRDVVDQLRAELSPEEQRAIAGPGPAIPFEAWEHFVRGRVSLAAWDSSSARDSFRRAIERAPAYGDAWAGLAQTYARQLVFFELPAREAYSFAREAARKALALDDSLAAAYMAQATLAFNHEWDFAAADRLSARALQLDPGAAGLMLDRGYILMCLGRTDEAVALTRRALTLDPLTGGTYVQMAWIEYYAGHHGEAVRALRRAIALSPAIAGWAWAEISWNELAAGHREEAAAACDQSLARGPDDQLTLATCGGILGALGRGADADAALARLMTQRDRPNFDAYNVAAYWLFRGDTDRAAEWFATAFAERSPSMPGLWIDVRGRPASSHPRVRALLAELGLPQGHRPEGAAR